MLWVQIALLIVVSPVILWIGVRIVGNAYFKSYFEQLRSHLDVVRTEESATEKELVEARKRLKNIATHFGKPGTIK